MDYSSKFMMSLLAAALPTAVISGCGCNILSSSQPAACTVSNTATLVAMTPLIGAKILGDNISNIHHQRTQQRLIKSGDMRAMKRCILMCDGFKKLKNSDNLLELSANRIIDSWNNDPSADQLAALMAAHARKARLLAKTNPSLAESHWQRAADLSTDPRITTSLQSTDIIYGYNTNSFDEIAISIQSSLMKLHPKASRIAPWNEDVSPANCKQAAAWPPAWMSHSDARANLMRACNDASTYLHLEASK
jgi:hypothetical protein